MAKMDYFHFAENDYDYIKEDLQENKRPHNAITYIAQSICERYLKHIINEYFCPQNIAEESEKKRILRTHNLNMLNTFILSNMDGVMSEEEADIIEMADGYYFTTRYPGDDSMDATERDIRKCRKAVEKARFVVMRKMEEGNR